MGDRRFRLKHRTLVAASVALIFSSASSWANPTGPQVVNGAVSFQQPAAGVLNVTNSPGSIIHWQGFSIGSSEITRFIQQSASSAVLNRVTGGNVSQIYGQLLSNGRVFLVNPGGIVVGPGAIVDTAGFVGSTLNMLDSDFLAGKLKFQGDSSSGSIVNQGWIRTGYGGQVVLVAPSIENSGLIHTPGGELVLAAGQKVAISSLDHEGVQFEVQAPTDSVVNVGRLLADGGAVGVFAGTLRNTGEIRANALVYDEAGRVVLRAQTEIQLAAGSSTSADGKTGGTITVQSSAGSTRVAGSVSATASAGAGGNVELLGNRVAVVENAVVDASGATRGGQVLVGGDYRGANAAVQNSSNTFVGASATLRADATQNGDGGRVVVWSDDKAQFYGSLSVQGGPQGGNGGFAEVSGKQGLVFDGRANLGAPRGALGNLLLDPLDLYVFAGGGLISTIIDEATDFPSNAATVSPATLAAIAGNVTLQASRYMRITDPIALTTAGQALTATVDAYTAPALPDPLALSSVTNRLDLAAGITTAGGAVTLSAPTIQSVAAAPISIATSGGQISLTGASQIQGSNLSLNAGTGAVHATTTAGSIALSAITGGSFTANAQGSISTGGAITTSGGAVSLTATSGSIFTSGGVSSGGGNVTMTAGSSVLPGTLAAGAGTVSLTGSGISGGTITTTGPVTLTANSSSISTTVNSASSLTATSPFGISINSTTNLNVANVTAGTTSVASLTTTAGSILGTGATPLVKGMDVSLFTSAGTGGGIGTAGTPLNVDVTRNFTFRPNGDFNILLTGSGPNFLNAQLTPANSGTYSGTLTKSGALTLNASADTSTVTVSNLNVTSGFDQRVFFQDPLIQISTTNGANLVVTTANVPTGDTVSTVTQPNGIDMPVTFSSAGSLTVNNYTRASGGLSKLTTFLAGPTGTVTLGTVNASKDTVFVTASGITVGSLISTGDIFLSSSGAVNAQSDSPGVEVTSGGTLTISGRGIGTSAGFSNPLDLAANSISLTSNISGAAGAIGGASPVIANTTSLTINATNGSTFNVSTGATSLTGLTVSANATSVGDTGLAQVSTDGGAALYVFDSNAGAFTFNPPASTGRNISFTSTSGNINLGATSLGTGNFTLTSNNGSIFTNGNSILAATVTLNAADQIDTSLGLAFGNITATGNIGLHGRTTVKTGTLDTLGQLAVDGNFSCNFCFPTVTVGTVGGTSAPSQIAMSGDTITTGAITSTGDVTLNARGGGADLTLSGAVITADGKTISLTAFGGLPFGFTQINAGATGTVNITASGGIQQTADGGSNGITAKTVSLTSGGSINNTNISFPELDLFGTTNMSVNTRGVARFDMHGSVLTDLSVTKLVAPLTSPFVLSGLGGSQSVSIANGTNPLEISVNSTTPLNFSLNTQGIAGTNMTLVGGGIATSGGNVALTSGGGIGGASPISSGAGNVTLFAGNGSVNLPGGITTSGGNVSASAFGASGSITSGTITTGGGSIQLGAATSIDVSGNLSAGAGAVTLVAGTSIARSGGALISSTTSVDAQAQFGDIGTSAAPLLISAPTVHLDAIGDTTPNTGRAFATLTGTTTLEVIGDNGFNVSSDTAFTTVAVETSGAGTGTPGAGTLNLTAPGQTYTFARPASDLFGAVTNTFQVVTVGGATPPTNARFAVIDAGGTLLVAGPGPFNVPNLELTTEFGADISLQGTAANPLTISGATQVFSATGAGGDLLIRGKVSLTATTSQSLSAAGSITVNADAGGGGIIAISAPTQTFLTSSAASKMEFLGGAASGEKVTVTSTTDQFVQTTSASLDAFKLLGGNGADSSVTFTHSGSGAQTFQMQSGTLTVAGGSGANSFAKLEETGTSTQRICFLTFFSCNPILSLNVLGGSGTGAFAQVTSAGAQDVRVSGTALNTGTVVKGGTGDGAHALVQAGTSQSFSSNGRLLVEGQGGAGAVARAEILANGAQSLNVGTTTVKAGASNGSLARIATTGTQNISASGTLSLLAQGTDSAPLQNASAVIEGNGQTIFASGGITINAGAGTATGAGNTSDAVLRNLAGSQSVNTSGALILDGGHQFSTAGILNLGTGPQSVSAGSGGLTLRSDTDFANPHADAIVAIQNQPATVQTINTSGPLKLTNSGGGTVGITTAGDQNVFAQYIEVLTNPTTEVGPNSSKISSAGTQKIFTQNLASTGFASLRVAALGPGDAAVESFGSQLIELDYPLQMQATNRDGRLIIGDVNAAGTSRVRAGAPADLTSSANQSIFARAITIQAGGNNSVSELKATGAQVITTLQGGIDVLGGSGNDSLAQIDPTLQTILSNGAINVIAGSGINAVAQIVANTGTTMNGQTILTTNGDITLEGGSAAGAGAFITNEGSSSFVGAAGEIFLTPGTAPGADAIISVGNGPGVLTATCGGLDCTSSLPPAGASPTGGIVANNLGGSSSSTLADTTSLTLPLQQTALDTLIVIAPEPTTGEPGVRRAPVCR